MKRKGFHYSWWALLNYLQLESYKILFKFKVMFSIFFVQVWLLGTHKHYCQTVYCWCCHVNICSKFFFYWTSCIQSLVKPAQTDLKNSLFRKKKRCHFETVTERFKKQQDSCLWQQMYLPPAWATDSQTSVGTLSSGWFYGWERVLLGFLWAAAWPRGPSYVLRKITQAPPPVIKMSCSIFVASRWFAVIYKHLDACLFKTRILIKGFHLKII